MLIWQRVRGPITRTLLGRSWRLKGDYTVTLIVGYPHHSFSIHLQSAQNQLRC